MDWAINVPQELLQSAAKTQPFTILFNSFIIIILYLFLLQIILRKDIAGSTKMFNYVNKILLWT